ncbi:hypothetical protein Syun_020573 [Stephania yunnanensis]|uniref:Uncharacterized protein n=1 Tax=Stephania yunnanensis TaxID=152371 RepID=A0AAP0IFC2_9MAGN
MFEKEARVDLTAGSRYLDTRKTIGDTTLDKMKYQYICVEMRWIREVDIPQGVQYEGYEDPHLSDPNESFDARDAREYLNYSFAYQQGATNEDHGVAPSNEEVH